MVPLTPPETQTRSITLQMNSKWNIKEAERDIVSTKNSIKKKKKMGEGKKHESRNSRKKPAPPVAKPYPLPHNSSNGIRQEQG